jgi:hypothetical protein
MYAKHPKIATEFQAATPKGAKLPEKVKVPHKTSMTRYFRKGD